MGMLVQKVFVGMAVQRVKPAVVMNLPCIHTVNLAGGFHQKIVFVGDDDIADAQMLQERGDGSSGFFIQAGGGFIQQERFRLQ